MKNLFLLSLCIISTFSLSTLKAQNIYDATIEDKEILTPKAGDEPQINTPEVYGARPGKPFIYRIPTTGLRPITFSANNLPDGLKLDKEKGIITGKTPGKKGNYAIEFTAANNKGKDTKIFYLIVGDKLALTPPMGWNHWQTYYHLITDSIMRANADAMAENGMADAGYQFVTLDDCWMRIEKEYVEQVMDPSRKTANVGLDTAAKVGRVRDENGKILTAADFPDMKAITDHIHSYGLRAGIYSSPGILTCQRFEGSYGYEILDAQTYAEWGFDLLKYDWCGYGHIFKYMKGDEKVNGAYPYKLMGGIMEQQDRDIVLSACQYGMHEIWEWGADAGWHYWRIGGDLAHTITEGGVYTIAEKTIRLREYNGPASWNDPDFLNLGNVVSPFDKGKPPHPVPLTTNEQYSYFSLWCMMACPLNISSELPTLDEFTLRLICNTEMIAVNQDKLGQCAAPVEMNEDYWVLKKTLADGSVVVGFFDLSDQENTLSVTWQELGLEGKKAVRDLWRQKDIGEYKDKIEVKLSPMGCAVFNLE